MLNHVILVGRLVQTPILQVTDSGKKVSSITLAVPRAYKNQNGEYDTDFFDCTLWTVVAENTAEYCKSGDVLGVKGRIQTKIIEKEDGSKYKKVEIIAERVSFLSASKSSKSVDNEEDIDLIVEGEVDINLDDVENYVDDNNDDSGTEVVKKSDKVAKKKK